jgi:hypothetical protein
MWARGRGRGAVICLRPDGKARSRAVPRASVTPGRAACLELLDRLVLSGDS